jgi:uncharacterized protein (TIGR02270 family)
MPVIVAVIGQHVAEAMHLYTQRTRLKTAPHVDLAALERFDDRLAAHLDGIAVAGVSLRPMVAAATAEDPAAGAFVAAATALVLKDGAWLEEMADLGCSSAAIRAGLQAALGWSSPRDLRGIITRFLGADSAHRRAIGLAACAMHGVPPGSPLGNALQSADADLRATAFRIVGQLGLIDFLPACLRGLDDPDPRCRRQAIRAAYELGDRGESQAALQNELLGDNEATRRVALSLLMRGLPPEDARRSLVRLHARQVSPREIIDGAGMVGSPDFVDWLIEQMSIPQLARLAGENFAQITGAQLDRDGLESAMPAGTASGPTEDAHDQDVALDEDRDLPWPDAARIREWWARHRPRFTRHRRYFVGREVSADACREVLLGGSQRRRYAAAAHLALLEPGRPRFNVAAPAWRQRRLLSGAHPGDSGRVTFVA